VAWYIKSSELEESDGAKDWWKTEYGPSSTVPVSGIYRCRGCKKEVTSNEGDPFPPQNHHQHTKEQGEIKWKLNIRTNTNGD
jgi:hypothetical protein